MSIQEEIVKAEKNLQTFKNNLEFAKKTNEKHRVSKYKALVQEEELKLRKLEGELPNDSNERLRDIIDGLRKEIAQEREARKIDNIMFANRIKKFELALNPPKVVEVKKEAVFKECPNCGRTIEIKSEKSMKTHQTRWCKKSS